MNRSLLMLGAGGHAMVLADALRQKNLQIVALICHENPSENSMFAGVEWFSSDDDVLRFDGSAVGLVNGVGSLPGQSTRAELYERFSGLGYVFETVVSPGAWVSDFAELGVGVQVMAGAVIQAGAKIGANTIVNTGVTIDHDCDVGANNHVAPGATLCGGVVTGVGVHIGTGANVIQNIEIGDCAVVGSGATITRNLAAHYIAYGPVAREAIREKLEKR